MRPTLGADYAQISVAPERAMNILNSPTDVDPRLPELEATLKKGLLPLWIYNDSEIFRQEMERVFAKKWIFMAHETEIPKSGDFVARTIGVDPFIVVRGNDGVVRVLFDSCRHKGARVCRADKGNARSFVCPYHGWTYDTAGKLSGIPLKDAGYKTLNQAEWGLMAAPRVGVYRGLIFATLDSAAPSLDDFLGDIKWYLDLHLCLSPQGMEVVGEPHRWNIDADWKSGSDNFAGDAYHTQSLHRSVVRIGVVAPEVSGAAGRKLNNNNVHITECSGHTTNFRCTDPGNVFFWGYPETVQKHFTCEQLVPAQKDIAQRSMVHTGTVFPNLSFLHLSVTSTPGEPVAPFLSLRQWNPIGPGKMEARSWVLVPKEASPEYKSLAYKTAVATFSPSGSFEQDDSTAWAGISRAAGSMFARSSGQLLNFQMGLPGMSEANVMQTWPGPGIAYDTNLEEGVQRTFYRHWLTTLLDKGQKETSGELVAK